MNPAVLEAIMAVLKQLVDAYENHSSGDVTADEVQAALKTALDALVVNNAAADAARKAKFAAPTA